MSESEELARLLNREHLPPAFERWHVTLAPRAVRPTSGNEWAGAVVLVQTGQLEVECVTGGSRTFYAGDLLVLGLLPLHNLRNRGAVEVRLLAVRRAGQRPMDRCLGIHRRRPGASDESSPIEASNQHRRAVMLGDTRAFSSFSVDDLEAAKRFYGEALGLNVALEEQMGMLILHLGGDGDVMLYAKDDHAAATFTVLNFTVDDIDAAVDELTERGVRFERYDGFEQDGKGIARPPSPDLGPPIAWFTDPAGNILALLEQPR